MVLIFPLLIAIGMVVGQGSVGRKRGRGRVDQEVERHLLPRHTPQNPTTFPYIPAQFPTFPHIFLRIFRFEQNTTVHDARAVGWERFIVLSLRRARQSYTLNVSQSYTTLHPSACLAILQLSAAILHFPAIPSNLAKLAEKG